MIVVRTKPKPVTPEYVKALGERIERHIRIELALRQIHALHLQAGESLDEALTVATIGMTPDDRKSVEDLWRRMCSITWMDLEQS